MIYAPSQSTCDELIEKGINAEKIRIYPRGIDIEQFSPHKRNGILSKKFNVKKGTTFIYVGRISKEKNLHLLAHAFHAIAQIRQDVNLVIVGDGPYLNEMRACLKDLPCYFTGYLQGNTLAQVYASADVFVFPSTTDTFGNVVLEAQASGLPVIVTDQGGPRENMVHGQTGLMVPGESAPALAAAMGSLADDPQKIRTMANAARQYIEAHSFESAFLKTWEMYCQAPASSVNKPKMSQAS